MIEQNQSGRKSGEDGVARDPLIRFKSIDMHERELLIGAYPSSLPTLNRVRKIHCGKEFIKLMDKVLRRAFQEESVFASMEDAHLILHAREIPLMRRVFLVEAWELLASHLTQEELARPEIIVLADSVLRLRVVPDEELSPRISEDKLTEKVVSDIQKRHLRQWL